MFVSQYQVYQFYIEKAKAALELAAKANNRQVREVKRENARYYGDVAFKLAYMPADEFAQWAEDRRLPVVAHK